MPSDLPRKRFETGSQIFREGEPGTFAYVVEFGRVEISSLRAGKKIVIANLGDGELFGEMALIDDEVRSATVTALEDTTVIQIDRDELKSKISRADSLLNLVLSVILGRFRWTQRLMLQSSPATQPATSLQDEAFSRAKLEQEMVTALEQGQFELYYQPIIALRGGNTAGFEALIRWNHPERGFVTPDSFIGLAEHTGLIVPIGHWVLDTALEALQSFQAVSDKANPNGPKLFMSVNVSGRQLIALEEIDHLGDVIKRSSVDPTLVKLEITESLMVDDPEHAAVALRRLKTQGVKIAIDDFGTGYSSLSYLHRFPLDTLKIDRSFVSNMEKDEGSLQIVRAITGLATDLGMDIVAEGIEEPTEITRLRDFGCDHGQGYLMSRPVPEQAAVDLWARRISW